MLTASKGISDLSNVHGSLSGRTPKSAGEARSIRSVPSRTLTPISENERAGPVRHAANSGADAAIERVVFTVFQFSRRAT